MSKIRKALVAALGAGATGIGAGFADGTLTAAEIGAAVGLAVAAALAVYGVRNAT